MEEDAELDIGVKFDEDQFSTTFNRFISKLGQDVALQIQYATDNMKGAAAKTWGSLPFYSMHSNATGNKAATQAFLPSFAEDLKKLGLGQSSEVYKSALMSAAYRSSIPDPQHRHNILQANGANALPADSVYERILSTDYELMSQPWARHFLKEHRSRKGLNAEDLNKQSLKELKEQTDALNLTVSHEPGKRAKKADYINALIGESQKTAATFDFDAMREEAVNTGLGRWIDPEKEHTAENFELVEKELEKINKQSSETKKNFRDWNDTLKGTVGILTAAKALMKIAGVAAGAAVTATKVSERAVVSNAASMDNRRAFLDMTPANVLETKTAGQSVGLASDAVFNEIEKFSSQSEEYKLLGKGLEALYPSLQGTFDVFTGNENPYERYKLLLQHLYKGLEGASKEDRRQALMLLNKEGMSSAAQIVGAFLSNEELATKYKHDPAKLFSLIDNPYRGAYEGSEAILPDITKLNESIKSSYAQLALDWQKEFGVPFKGWWDDFLKNTMVPWFHKFSKKPTEEESADFGAAIWGLTNRDAIEDIKDARNVYVRSYSWGKNISALGGAYPGAPYKDFGRGTLEYKHDVPGIPYYVKPKTKLPKINKRTGLEDWFGFNKLPTEKSSADAVEAQWALFEKLAAYKEKDLEGRPDLVPYVERAKKIVDAYDTSGISKTLKDDKKDLSDFPLLYYAQMGLYNEKVNINGKTYSGMEVWEANFEDMLSDSMARVKADGNDKLVELLTKLNVNADTMRLIMQQDSMREILESVGGKVYYGNAAEQALINRE